MIIVSRDNLTIYDVISHEPAGQPLCTGVTGTIYHAARGLKEAPGHVKARRGHYCAIISREWHRFLG